MATIYAGVDGDTIKVERRRSVAGGDSDRVLACVVRNYGVDEEGRARTPAEAVSAAIDAWFEAWLAKAQREEADIAAETERNKITPIVSTAVDSAVSS